MRNGLGALGPPSSVDPGRQRLLVRRTLEGISGQVLHLPPAAYRSSSGNVGFAGLSRGTNVKSRPKF
jgi:hypothetical protein